MQTNNRLFDDFARMASGAMNAAAGVREEFEVLVRRQLERLLERMDLVSREEFDAVKAMAAKARSEQEALAKRVVALEATAQSSGKPAAKGAGGAKPARAKAKKAGKAKAKAATGPGGAASKD
jgi:BMFP domain-containing protein YqiC